MSLGSGVLWSCIVNLTHVVFLHNFQLGAMRMWSMLCVCVCVLWHHHIVYYHWHFINKQFWHMNRKRLEALNMMRNVRMIQRNREKKTFIDNAWIKEKTSYTMSKLFGNSKTTLERWTFELKRECERKREWATSEIGGEAQERMRAEAIASERKKERKRDNNKSLILIIMGLNLPFVSLWALMMPFIHLDISFRD